MEAAGVRAAVETLIATDVSVADHGELADVSRSLSRLQTFIDHAKVQIARRTRQLADDGDTASSHVLIDEGRCTGNDVKTNNGRDRVCGELPGFEHALAAGDVTGAHLDQLAALTTNLDDAERSDLAAVADELVANAATSPAALFGRTAKAIIDRIRNQHRPDSDVDELDRQRAASKVKRWTDRDTGMRNTLVSLDPIRDASLWNAINAQLATLRQDPANQQRPFADLQVDAVLASVNATPGTRVPEVVVHVDDRSLCHGHLDLTLSETIDGAPVPLATVQRLCCEAFIQAVVVDPDGTVDRICAEQRTANRRQRRMLAAMYSTCAHPHCEVTFSACRIHHITWWTRGGKTVLANLVPLCEAHHHLVHEGRWNLTIDERRHVTWYRPDGTTWHTDTGPNRRPASVSREPAPGSPGRGANNHRPRRSADPPKGRPTGSNERSSRATDPVSKCEPIIDRPNPPPDATVRATRKRSDPARTPHRTAPQPTLL